MNVPCLDIGKEQLVFSGCGSDEEREPAGVDQPAHLRDDGSILIRGPTEFPSGRRLTSDFGMTKKAPNVLRLIDAKRRFRPVEVEATTLSVCNNILSIRRQQEGRFIQSVWHPKVR